MDEVVMGLMPGYGLGMGMYGMGGMGGMGYPYGMMAINPYGYSGMVSIYEGEANGQHGYCY